MNRSEYIIAESHLMEAVESCAINSHILDTHFPDVIAVFGADSIFTKAVNFFKNLANKYGGIMDAVVIYMRDVRPLVFDKANKFVLPSKFNILKWVKIGWHSAGLIIKIVKILNK